MTVWLVSTNPEEQNVNDDRTVHARIGEQEIVRYDRAGKWWVEWVPDRMRGARQVSLGEAVDLAVKGAELGTADVFLDKPGGGMFDAKFRKSRA